MKIFLAIYLYAVLLLFILTIPDWNCYIFSPKQLCEYHNLNMFGGVLLSAFAIACNPLLAVVRFLYWIIHV